MTYTNSRLFTWFTQIMKSGIVVLTHYAFSLLAVTFLAGSINPVSAGEVECGSLENHFGPWDYYDPANHRANAAQSEGRIGIVTGAHLSNSMLRLDRGKTALQIREDLDYTLRAIPNHPRALDLASRFSHQRSTSESFRQRQKNLKLSVECYFDRAFRLSHNNPETWKLYGIHNHRIGNYEKAVSSYKKALELGSNTADVNYNIGLSYFEAGDYSNAKLYATKAYDGGFPLQGLKIN